MLEGDAAFFAHARTDVPDLVAEVERLSAERTRLLMLNEVQRLKLQAVEDAIGPAWVKASASLADAVVLKTRALEKVMGDAP